jgi:hypothetical protein
VVAYSSSQVVLSGLLRLTVYTFFALIPATSLISSGLDMNEKAVVLALSLFSLRVFELASEGTVFKPRVAAPFSSGRYIGMSEEKLAEKLYAQKLIRASVGALSSYFKPKARNTEIDGRPGLQAVAALDLFGEEEVGPELMPSKSGKVVGDFAVVIIGAAV